MKDIKNLTDEELVNLVITRDQEYYQELVERYQERLLRYAVYLLGDANEAQDPVQEAFIKAFINLKGFNQNQKFSSWIYRIVHNETMNYIKKGNKTINLSIDDQSHHHHEPDEEVEKKEMSKLLKEGLSSLPIQYRGPLALFYLEEKTYEEISDVLRIPTGTVGTNIRRGKKMLREILKKKEAEVYVR